MSAMISQPTQLDSEPTIKNKLRKVTFNASNFSSPQLSKWNKQSQERQHLLLKNICKKFAVRQQDIIREKSSEEITQQLKELKHRLRHALEKQNIQKIMSEGQSTKRENCLDKVLRERTEMVDIGKKYNKKIKLKLTMFNEADQIVTQKGSYKEWYDHSRNTFDNSPMYHQMNYLIDRNERREEKPSKQPRPNNRNTLDEQLMTYNSSCYTRKKRSYEEKIHSRGTKNKI